MDARSDNSVSLGRLGHDLGYLLRQAQIRVYERYFHQCAEYRVKPGEFSVLWAIGNNPGIRQSLLCQHLVIKRSHMTKLVRALEDQGYVERRIPDGDRRGVELSLTSEGQQAVDAMSQWFFAFEDSLGSGMSAAERDQFTALLHKFIETTTTD